MRRLRKVSVGIITLSSDTYSYIYTLSRPISLLGILLIKGGQTNDKSIGDFAAGIEGRIDDC